MNVTSLSHNISNHQNVSFRDNCTALGSVGPIDETTPKLAVVTSSPGTKKDGVLKTLNASVRNSSLYRSLKGKALKIEKSTFRRPGPDTFDIVLEEFPYVNGAGIEKHAVLNQRASVGFGKFGSQPGTTFGRFVPPEDRAKGEPDISVAMALSC